MVYVMLAPQWLQDEFPNELKAFQGTLTKWQLEIHNKSGYGIYYYPNYPKLFHNDGFIKGTDIDVF